MALNIFKKKKKDEPQKAKKPAAVQRAPMAASAQPAASSNPALRHFHVSEKSSRGLSMNQYTFLVDPRATKTQVRDAVKKSYNVDVRGVNIVRLPAKHRTLGRYQGTVPAKKKAIVTVAEGQTITSAQS